MSNVKRRQQKKPPGPEARPLSAELALTLKALKLTEEAALGARVFSPTEPNSLTPPQIPQRLTSVGPQ